jgi:hypothetical protein
MIVGFCGLGFLAYRRATPSDLLEPQFHQNFGKDRLGAVLFIANAAYAYSLIGHSQSDFADLGYPVYFQSPSRVRQILNTFR